MTKKIFHFTQKYFSVYDIYMPKHAQGPVSPHTIVTLPNTNGMQLLLCYDNEGVYVNTYGKVTPPSFDTKFNRKKRQ